MKLRRSHWVISICLTLLSAGASSLAASRIDQPNALPRDTPAPQAKDSDYVGAEVCKTCHEEIYNSWEKTPHWKTTLDTKGGPSHQGCEGCHGPGAAHVAGGGDKSKIFVFAGRSTKEIDDRCMVCHATSIEHKNAVNSLHHQNDVSCISCHSPHHAQTTEYLFGQASAGTLLHLPFAAEVSIRYALSSSGGRGARAVHGLPQSSRHRIGKAGAGFLNPGRRLLQVPRRQAWPVRIRT